MKNLKFGIFLITLFLLAGILYQNFRTPRSSSSGKMQIATSFYPLYFFASEIAGDRAEVYTITPNGSEPHDYEPTAKDIARIEASKLLIINGAKLEPWANKLTPEFKNKNIVVISVGDTLATEKMLEDGAMTQDPHIWLSPPNAIKEIDTILSGFIQIDKNNSQYYQERARALNIKLYELDQKYKTGLATCNQKTFVTSHAAFSYLAKAYGLTQVSISGLSPDEEPSTKQLAETADAARINKVKYIFFESLVSPKLSETVAAEIGADTLVLDPIEGVAEDDMKSGKNYFTIMEDNLKNLRIALECQ